MSALLLILILTIQGESAPGWEYPLPPTLQDEERPGPRDRGSHPPQPVLVHRDLWYGTPGARPGGDLLTPILELFRRPSGLLDFRPRSVPSIAPSSEDPDARRPWRPLCLL